MIPAPPSSAVAAKIAACGDMASLIAAFDAFVADVGARCAVWQVFEGGLEAAVENWKPVHSSFPKDLQRVYAENRCIVDDPFVRAGVESPLPVCLQEIKDGLVFTGSCVGLYERYHAVGLVDGLFMHVCDRPGRLAYIALAFDHQLKNTSKYELIRLHAAVAMFARQATALQEAARAKTLSPGERAVVAWLVRGASNKEIARSLGLSLSTVNTLVNRCFSKLGASTRAQAAVAATRSEIALVA